MLRLRPGTPTTNTAIVAFDNFEQITGTLSHMSARFNASINAFEILWNDFYCLSTDGSLPGAIRAPLPRTSHAYAIIETRGSNEESDLSAFLTTMEQTLELGLISDAVIAQSESERANIWSIRENVDLTMRHQPLFIYDISLPITSMQNYLNQIKASLKALWPDVVVYAYGHLADSNLHITIAPNPDNFNSSPDTESTHIQVFNDEETQWYEQATKIVFEPLTALSGSISAEHGIGLLKKKYLHYSRTSEEIAAMSC